MHNHKHILNFLKDLITTVRLSLSNQLFFVIMSFRIFCIHVKSGRTCLWYCAHLCDKSRRVSNWRALSLSQCSRSCRRGGWTRMWCHVTGAALQLHSDRAFATWSPVNCKQLAVWLHAKWLLGVSKWQSAAISLLGEDIIEYVIPVFSATASNTRGLGLLVILPYMMDSSKMIYVWWGKGTQPWW